MSFLRLSLHFSYLKMLQNAKFWCSIFLPMPGPYSVYQVASLDCWHIGLCTIHPWPKQSPQMTLSNQAVKRTGLRPLTLFVSPITHSMRTATYFSARPCSKGLSVFLASSACQPSTTSYHSCSAAPLPWPSAFSWAAHVFKAGRSLLAFGSNSALKLQRW